jgi:hypothetical protein
LNKKFVGILVCTLLIAVPVLSVTGINESEKKNSNINILNNQPPIQWEKTYGFPEAGWSQFVQQTSDGGYIATGVIYQMGGTDAQVYLVKTDANGNTAWTNTFGVTSTFDCGYCVQQTTDGGYIISGIYSGYGLWIIKTDSSGNQQWNNVFISNGVDTAYSVQQTNDGGYILVGGYQYLPGGASDVWLIKTDSSGVKQWDKKFGLGGEYGYCVRQTTDGGFIITGSTNSYGAGNNDVYLIKTDAAGTSTWTQTFGGIQNDAGYSVRQTSDGGYIVTGYTYSFGAGQSDVYLIKTDSGGNPTWTQTFGGTNDEIGESVRQTTDGGYIIGGTTQTFGSGGIDIYLIKTDSGGNKQWDDTYGGAGHDDGKCVQQTSDGYYIIAGSKFTTYNAFWLIKLGITTNQPPNTPSKPTGQVNGDVGTSYTYTSTTIDLDGDKIYYWFNWGDGTNSGWIGPFTSGTAGSASHTWTTKGNYQITVKAKDDPYGAESGFSPPLTVTMPRGKLPINTMFLRFLERFPNSFPLLRHILGL